MMNTKRLTTLALLSAVYVVLAVMTPIRLINFKFTFEAFPVLVTAFLMGPVDGMLVGILGSGLYQVLASGYGITPTTPLWILPHAFSGFLAGFLARRMGEEMTFLKTGLIAGISAVTVTLLNTLALYADSKMYGSYSSQLVFGMLLIKILTGILLAEVYALIMPKLIEQLRKIVR